MPLDLPNALTIARIVAILPLALLVAWRTPATDLAAALLFAVAAATDWLDGYLARRRSRPSDLGRMLDPIADKLLVGATLLLLAGSDRLGPVGMTAALAILLREILVSGLREHLAASGGVALPVTRLAKWKTAAQMLALPLLLVGDDAVPGWRLVAAGEGLLAIAAVLTVRTGWEYLRAALREMSRSAARS